MAMYPKVNSLAFNVVFVLLSFCFLCETVMRSKDGCIVCGKKSQNIPFRSSASYCYDLEACFGFNPINVNAGDICEGCGRAVQEYRSTGKTFHHFVDMNRIQCGRVPKRKYSVPDESVNSSGKEMVLLPKETFLKMDQKLKMLSERCNLKEELNLVKKKIYSELVLKKEGNIYDPHKFWEFCISAGANKLFDTILSAVTTPRQSKDRTEINQKRVVSVIYNLCYCLSQTCNPRQIDHALYLRSSQVNQEGMQTEHIMRNSCARRTLYM